MAHVVVREVVSVPPWYTTANSAASLSSGSSSPVQTCSACGEVAADLNTAQQMSNDQMIE